jgi:hypothetical protein
MQKASPHLTPFSGSNHPATFFQFRPDFPHPLAGAIMARQRDGGP